MSSSFVRGSICVVVIGLVAASACASAQEDTIDFSPRLQDDASPDGNAGSGGAGTGGFGTGGDFTGGTGGLPSSGGSAGAGSCDPLFCPSASGPACCVTPQGPCGVDLGMGCTAAPANDF
jgi:hypothetical protein